MASMEDMDLFVVMVLSNSRSSLGFHRFTSCRFGFLCFVEFLTCENGGLNVLSSQTRVYALMKWKLSPLETSRTRTGPIPNIVVDRPNAAYARIIANLCILLLQGNPCDLLTPDASLRKKIGPLPPLVSLSRSRRVAVPMQRDLLYPIRQEKPGKCSLSRELHLPELDRGGWMVLKRLDPLAPHLTRYSGARAR